MNNKENPYIGKLYEDYRDHLVDLVSAQINGNEEAAADLVADAFLEYLKRDDFLSTCRKSTQVKALFRITQRHCDRYIEQMGYCPSLLLREESSYAAYTLPKLSDLDDIYMDHIYMEDLVANLYGDERVVVESYYFLGMSSREISAKMGISMDTFYKKHSRALEKLRWFSKHC